MREALDEHIEFVILEVKRLRKERWLHPLIVGLSVGGAMWSIAPLYFTLGLVGILVYIAEARAEIQLAVFRLEHAKLLRDHQELFLKVSRRVRGGGTL